jgi:ribonuclease PH
VPRPDGRVLERRANPYAEGSCLIRMGGTLVHCTASVEAGVPGFKKGTGEGWVTAEYAMQEIQRLIGRSLRAAMATMAFGEFTIRIDCDVLQADGGTRTAGITGGCVALADACTWLAERTSQPSPFGQLVAAVSVGVVEGEVRLDLAYAEDKDAGVDANIVMVEPAEFVEVQGTGEHATFTRAQFETMLDSAERGIVELFRIQRQVLGW